MQRIGFDDLKDLIIKARGRKVMITFHTMGDTDSVASAIALSEYLSDATIVTPDEVTSNSARIMKRLGYSERMISDKFSADADAIILVDVNNFDECGQFRQRLAGWKKEMIVIDHHLPKPYPNKNVSSFNDEAFNSASSIVFELLGSLNHEPSRNAAKLLAMGIISDSAEFKNASPKTFIQIGKLLSIADTDYISLLDEMGNVAPPEVRAQTIKDLLGATVLIKDNLLFVYGATKFHAGIAADDAIRIGADIVLFVSEDQEEVSFSARMRPPLDKKYHLHMGEIMASLAKHIGGVGGGHPCAAGAYGKKKSGRETFTEKFVLEVLKRIKESNKRIR
ncbi:MAG: DHH family phosphoesterase [Candidatus Micrarchaeota archaeon]|nr:DHH family phosphoesterase [Candidatus Micrarchaeota archaeon]